MSRAIRDHISHPELIAGDVHELAVDQYMAVAHHLAGLEWRAGKAQAPDGGRQSKLEKPEEVEAGIAVHPLRFLKGVAELLFQQVVVAADDLLGQKLLAIFGLSPVLEVGPVLTGRVSPL